RERGWETHAVELTDEALEVLRGKGHHVFRAPLSTARLPAGSFDVVVYTEVIEHINQPLEELGAIRKALSPGGLLYVTTPNFNSVSRRVLGAKWNVVVYPEHLCYYTPRTLLDLASRVGLTPLFV